MLSAVKFFTVHIVWLTFSSEVELHVYVRGGREGGREGGRGRERDRERGRGREGGREGERGEKRERAFYIVRGHKQRYKSPDKMQ